MKIALFATALFWLIVWGVHSWRVGADASALGRHASLVVGSLLLGALSFGARSSLRWTAAAGCVALALALGLPALPDTRLLVGGLGVAWAATMESR